ncbi:MAG TPA: DNA-binding response regulator, partial [Anaeromyxobacter sp.]|nr:DNA-binding response regulator [Anaeromyxobacter sp.]
MPPVRLLLAGDDPLARAGLASLLSGRADVAVAAESAIDDAPRAAGVAGADAVLLDLGSSGAAPAPVAALAEAVHAPVVALASTEAQAAAAIRSGARAVLFRGASADALAAAALAAARGLAAIDAALAREWLRPPGAPADAEVLT